MRNVMYTRPSHAYFSRYRNRFLTPHIMEGSYRWRWLYMRPAAVAWVGFMHYLNADKPVAMDRFHAQLECGQTCCHGSVSCTTWMRTSLLPWIRKVAVMGSTLCGFLFILPNNLRYFFGHPCLLAQFNICKSSGNCVWIGRKIDDTHEHMCLTSSTRSE